jgi:hypothetical protein
MVAVLEIGTMANRVVGQDVGTQAPPIGVGVYNALAITSNVDDLSPGTVLH